MNGSFPITKKKNSEGPEPHSERLSRLERAVVELYKAEKAGHDDWSPWLIDNHVIVVANYASDLAKRYKANRELSRAAALLHDIADTVMARSSTAHEAESLNIARRLMRESGYSKEEIELVVDDAIKLHSCHDGKSPSSQEGKILATADVLAHLKTDFYLYSAWAFGEDGRTLDSFKNWARPKLRRDYFDKIQFEEVRSETKPDFELLKELLSR